MRRTLLLTLLVALAAPVAASAASAPTTEGTLSVRGGDGRLSLVSFRGAIIGRVEQGRLTIVEPKAGSCESLLVWAWDAVRETTLPGGELGQGRLACVYTGTELRFRLTGPNQEVRLKGRNIGASIVGWGTAILEGEGGFFDGLYSLNADVYHSLPDQATRLVLGTPAPVVP